MLHIRGVYYVHTTTSSTYPKRNRPDGTGSPQAIADEGADGDEGWEDESEVSEDPEASAAVDRVLKKYERADVVEEEEEDFDVRHDRALQERMDQWKRGYYKV